jgi:hypothetical protein
MQRILLNSLKHEHFCILLLSKVPGAHDDQKNDGKGANKVQNEGSRPLFFCSGKFQKCLGPSYETLNPAMLIA